MTTPNRIPRYTMVIVSGTITDIHYKDNGSIRVLLYIGEQDQEKNKSTHQTQRRPEIEVHIDRKNTIEYIKNRIQVGHNIVLAGKIIVKYKIHSSGETKKIQYISIDRIISPQYLGSTGYDHESTQETRVSDNRLEFKEDIISDGQEAQESDQEGG